MSGPAPAAPRRPLTVSVYQDLAVKTRLWRAHDSSRPALGYWPGSASHPTRFAPITDTSDTPIPVLYLGLKREGALFESVFHDLPAIGYRAADVDRLQGRVLSRARVRRRLHLADLTKYGLPSLGATRDGLIESEAARYTETAQWAEAIHRDNPEAEGLYWISRQNDRVASVMLFGDRVGAADLHLTRKRIELWHGKGLGLVLKWAERAEIVMY